MEKTALSVGATWFQNRNPILRSMRLWCIPHKYDGYHRVDCPEDLAKGETGQQIGYDIDLKEDGTVDVYFARSGKRVGEGYHNNTNTLCYWYVLPMVLTP